MPIHFLKLQVPASANDPGRIRYLAWSTIVDAPLGRGMDLAEFRRYLKHEYGRAARENLRQSIRRMNAKGTSCPWHESAEETIRLNRAGPEESELTLAEIIDQYCIFGGEEI